MNNNIPNELKETLLRLTVTINAPTEINIETDLINDLQFDSVLIVQMVVEIEDHFDIIFDDEDMDIDIITSFKCLCELIEEKVFQKDKV